jgi:hypothetical protein
VVHFRLSQWMGVVTSPPERLSNASTATIPGLPNLLTHTLLHTRQNSTLYSRMIDAGSNPM